MRNQFVHLALMIACVLIGLVPSQVLVAQAQAGGPSARVGASLVNVDGRIFLFGGQDSSMSWNGAGGKLAAPALRPLYGQFNDLWEFSEDGCSFSELTPPDPKPAPRHGHAAAAADGKMYVFGGMGADGPLHDAWVYDPASNQWTELNLTGANNKIVFQPGLTVIGGRDELLIVTGDGSVYAYLIAEEFVGRITADPLPVTLNQPGIGAVNGHPLIFGGWDGATQAQNPNAYLFMDQKWLSIPCTGESLALESATVVSQGNTMWVIGGLDEGRKGDILQVKIDETASRCTVEKVASNILDYGRSNASAVLLPGSTEANPRILLFGGDAGGAIAAEPLVIELGKPTPTSTATTAPTATPTPTLAPQSSPIPSETPPDAPGDAQGGTICFGSSALALLPLLLCWIKTR